jgi:hypothetical protein
MEHLRQALREARVSGFEKHSFTAGVLMLMA